MRKPVSERAPRRLCRAGAPQGPRRQGQHRPHGPGRAALTNSAISRAGIPRGDPGTGDGLRQWMTVTFPANYGTWQEAVFKIKVIDRLHPPAAGPEQRLCQEGRQGGHHGGIRPWCTTSCQAQGAAVNQARNPLMMTPPRASCPTSWWRTPTTLMQPSAAAADAADAGQVRWARCTRPATSSRRPTAPRKPAPDGPAPIAGAEGLLPTDAEVDAQLAQRAEMAKKLLTDQGKTAGAFRRNEAIRRAADWVIQPAPSFRRKAIL